eukprot:163069_1
MLQSALLQQLDDLIQTFHNQIDTACKGTNCGKLNRLINTYKNKYGNDTYTSKFTFIINDYIHVLLEHNNDDDFEYICSQFGYCDISKCAAAHRIYCKKTKNPSMATNINIAMQQIMDKIHCYYSHTFDIGYRLNASERQSISCSDTEQKSNNELYYNYKLLKIKQLINKKQNFYFSQMKHRHQTKLNQLGNKQPDEIDENMYSFGYKFRYGYSGEHRHSNPQPIPVQPKYSSLKEELTTNAISIMAMDQFNHEYVKAKIHYDSEYCKKTFVPYCDDANMEWTFLIDYVLSLMIYCNYTELQYHFTKTYRDNCGEDHNSFYHLATNLKISIHQFGKPTVDSYVKIFFHGISEQVKFPYYGNVSIFNPLSTTSSFSVATSFTNNNNGMIVEFTDNKGYSTSFSVSWLSDYPNENEYIFIQNGYGLWMRNIFIVKFGYQFNTIIKSVNIIQAIISNQEFDKDVDSMIKDLVIDIMQNNEQTTIYRKYAAGMIKSYFEGRKGIHINYTGWKQETCLFDAFCLSDYEWIRMMDIISLCPNLNRLNVINVNLCSKTLNNIFSILKQNILTLKKINILGNATNSDIRTSVEAFKNRVERCQNVHYRINVDCYKASCDIYINYKKKAMELPEEPESDDSSD